MVAYVQAAIRIKGNQFSGLSKVSTTDRDSLANILKGIARDLAREKIENAKIADFTDSSGGTASVIPYFIQDLFVPTTAFNALSAGGANRANFNTATGVMENQLAVLCDWVNRARGRVGLPLVTFADGTIATAGTIPVATAAVGSTSGTSALDFVDGIAKMALVKNNMDMAVQALNETFNAIGFQLMTGNGVFTVSSGTYNTSTGAGTVTLAAGVSWQPGQVFTLAGLTGTGAFASLNGSQTVNAAGVTSSGTVVNFTAATGLGAATITGGNAVQPPISRELTPITGIFSRTQNPIYGGTFALQAVAAAAASATGASSISQVVVNQFQAVFANNIATMAAAFNQAFLNSSTLANLTDSSGGTASTAYPMTMVALVLPTPVVGSATVNTPSVGFNAQLVIEANAIASLNSRLQALRGIVGLNPYLDSSGGTVSTTLAAMAATTTAVDGSGGTLGADAATTIAAMTAVENDLSTVCAGINQLLAQYGYQSVVDNSGGVVSAATPQTLSVITAPSVSAGGAPANCLTNSVTNTWLASVRNNFATLAAALAYLTGTDIDLSPPLHVVAI